MNIGLFCAAGMSTSILVERMKEAAQKKGKDAQLQLIPSVNWNKELEILMWLY